MSNISDDKNENAFKHAFDGALLQQIANSISRYFPSFRSEQFLKIESELTNLEMKSRVKLIRDALANELPQEYPKALKILVSVLNENQLSGFSVWPIAEYIQTYGLNNLDVSLNALKLVTTRFTSEWAVRPFIKKYPDETMNFLLQCAKDEDVNIRRWASEGTRPRVPWGEQLQEFIKNPSATKDILEVLKFDPELFVRKSVANHLNDISKDHPAYVIQLLKNWQQQAKGEDEKKVVWIIKHALRTLIKDGNPGALALIGVQYGAQVTIDEFSVKQQNIKLGEHLEFDVLIRSTSNAPQKIVIDYIIHFMKANKKTMPKVFKLRAFELPANGLVTIGKKHIIKKITTREYYEGIQQIEIQVNGKAMGKKDWRLEL
ncbi:DNA alkylation repair protein [Limnobaculum zhutongyuii]|uniref:DNA alkylation repair protein n=1 Tax=Limnobaculum zhutongyuii TaxID=2498113 RepID=A0A411WJK4_9GAMM|nr:DNA alkylation repair protein [Limnobaculum zhutongyuii]QBH96362.1 DNA alkylation repair protein [Limnobaculum zhutongyuii]TQS86658.1 DNA alkylation repair protein [Limnobaculum zhutongyuii]